MSRYLIKVTEEHRADSEAEATALIEESKHDSRFVLSKYSSVHKEVKAKGEVVDEYYLVSLVKVFDDAKYPCGDAQVNYTIGAF